MCSEIERDGENSLRRTRQRLCQEPVPALTRVGGSAVRTVGGYPVSGWPPGQYRPATPHHSVECARSLGAGGLFLPTHFCCGRRERCTFPTAPWPAAASTTSPAPRPLKSTTYRAPVPRTRHTWTRSLSATLFCVSPLHASNGSGEGGEGTGRASATVPGGEELLAASI